MLTVLRDPFQWQASPHLTKKWWASSLGQVGVCQGIQSRTQTTPQYGYGNHKLEYVMTFDEDEFVYCLISVTVALIVVSNILWIIMQVIALREGHKPSLISYWRNLKEIRHLFCNQDDANRRRRYMLIMNLFNGCIWAVVVLFFVGLIVLFLVGVLR